MCYDMSRHDDFVIGSVPLLESNFIPRCFTLIAFVFTDARNMVPESILKVAPSIKETLVRRGRISTRRNLEIQAKMSNTQS